VALELSRAGCPDRPSVQPAARSAVADKITSAAEPSFARGWPASAFLTDARQPERVAESLVGVIANPLVAIRRPRVARVVIIAVNAISKTQAKADPWCTETGEAVTIKAVSKATSTKAMTGKAMTGKTAGEAAATEAMTGKTAREAASTEAAVASTEAAVAATKAAVAATKAAVETSAESPVTATSAVSERQGICRNCCGAKQAGCSDRDSNLI
jgi:hypothetical protein